MIYLVFTDDGKINKGDEIFSISNSSPFLVNILSNDYEYHLFFDISKKIGYNIEDYGIGNIDFLKGVVDYSLKKTNFLIFGLIGLSPQLIYELIMLFKNISIEDKCIAFIYRYPIRVKVKEKKKGIERVDVMDNLKEIDEIFEKYEKDC